MKQPCEINCEKRDPYCRGNCDKWTEYESKRNEEYKGRLEKRMLNECLSDGVHRISKSHYKRTDRSLL